MKEEQGGVHRLGISHLEGEHCHHLREKGCGGTRVLGRGAEVSFEHGKCAVSATVSDTEGEMSGGHLVTQYGTQRYCQGIW